MPENEDLTQAVYRVARELLPEMDEPLRREVASLLERAERGEKTDNLLVERISADERLRPRLRNALAAKRTLSCPPAAGDIVPPAARRYVCPQCDYVRYLQKAGQEPGECPEHHLPLIPYEQKAGSGC